MKQCPFCGFNEGWIKIHEDGFKVECNVCKSSGPKSKTREGAIKKWNGSLKNIDLDSLNIALEENVGAPMSTLNNTPGIGNAVPPSSNNLGSGDKWGGSTLYTQSGNKKKRKVYKKTKKKLNENNISPYDKIGIMMAKKLKVPMIFQKGDNQSKKHVKQKNNSKEGRLKVMSYSEYANLIPESLNEAFKIKGSIFDTISLDKYNKVLVGPDGILGDKDTIIPWDIVKALMKKYNVI